MILSYSDFGEGTPILLLHAFPLSNKMWEPNIKPLIKNNFRVITPDLPGFGSSPLNHKTTGIEMMAKEVKRLLVQLKIKKVILGGISMGGYIAFNFFRLYPKQISGLIFCDTTSRGDTVQIRENRIRLIELIKQNGSKILCREMLPNLLSDSTKQFNPGLVSKLETEISKCNPDSAMAALRGMAERVDQTGLLTKINCPALLIFGEEDRPTNLETARMLKKNIRGSKLAIISKAGHYSNLENPSEFNSVLNDFLQHNNFDN